MIHIARADKEFTEYVAKHLRESDKREMANAGRTNFEDAVRESVDVSPFAFCALNDGVPLCVFGVKPDSVLSPRARLWMLGTPNISLTKKSFVRQCRIVVDGLLDIYPVLYNAVDANYPQAIRLLQFLGATFGKTVKSSTGAPFLIFEIRRKK